MMSGYINQRIHGASHLAREEEYRLAHAWKDCGDQKSLQRLVVAYVPLAYAMAAAYRGYGIDHDDLTQCALEGLVVAAQRFDPSKGFRLSTYARWWIKAHMQDCIVINWSQIHVAKTRERKTLFFSLRKRSDDLHAEARAAGFELSSDAVCEQIAADTGYPAFVVQEMQERLSGRDLSLNAPFSKGEDSGEWIDQLEGSEDTERSVEKALDGEWVKNRLRDAFAVLDQRERLIIRRRVYTESKCTLAVLSNELSISVERVRQIEASALSKMKKYLLQKASPIKTMIRV